MTFRSLRPQSVHGRQAEARRNDLMVLEAARDVFTAQGADAPVSAGAAPLRERDGAPDRPVRQQTRQPRPPLVVRQEQAAVAAGAAGRGRAPRAAPRSRSRYVNRWSPPSLALRSPWLARRSLRLARRSLRLARRSLGWHGRLTQRAFPQARLCR